MQIKENVQKFWYKHGEKVEAIGAGILILGATTLTGITGVYLGINAGYKNGFKSGLNKGLELGHRGLQLFIKNEVPEAYKMIDDVIISKKNL